MIRRLLWLTFLLLDTVLLALFVAGYSARYLPPPMLWWTELIAIGLPYMSLLLVAAAVVVVAKRRWRLLALHLGLILLALFRFVPLGSGASEARPAAEGASEVLTLMTFNIPRWGGSMEEKVRELAALTRSEAPDLIALQEARAVVTAGTPRVQGAAYLTALVDTLDYTITGQQGRSYATVQPVLSRFRLQSQSEQRLDAGPEDKSGFHVVRVQFTWQGREAVLYNLHLRTYGHRKPWRTDDLPLFDVGFWSSYLRQYRQAYRLRAHEVERVRALLAQETLPYIVCGDFNSTPHNWAYRHMKAELGLQDAFLVAGSGWGATYHTRLPFARIDFILASPAWEVVSAHVPDVYLSDHRPLVARLRWRSDTATGAGRNS